MKNNIKHLSKWYVLRTGLVIIWIGISFGVHGVASAKSQTNSGNTGVLQQVDAAVTAKDYDHAKEILQSAINANTAKNSAGDPGSLAKLWHRLAFVSRLQGEHYAAIDQLNQAVKLARSIPDEELLAELLYDLGSSHLTVGELDLAVTTLNEANKLFKKPYKNDLPVRSQINLAQALIENRQPRDLHALLLDIGNNIDSLSNNRQRAELLLSLGRLYQLAQQELGLDANWRKQAHDMYVKSANQASGLQQPIIDTYLDGFMGQLYEQEARFDEAMTFTRRAVFSAQNAHSDQALFKWEWQIARLLKDKGDRNAALGAYRQAIGTLQKVRLSLLMGAKSNFKRYIEPLYYQYFDLLLKQARSQKDSRKLYQLLREAIDALENYRISEVEDYFQSACVESDTNRSVRDIDPATAVVYPLILEDRVELIVAINNRLTLYTTTVDRARVTRTVNRFRKKLENPRLQSGYLQDAKLLYRWLVKPFVETAAKSDIKNLLFVPDGPLRSIPMTALHDGHQYLIEKFTIATTPSLSLTKLGRSKSLASKILANGVTKAVQGYGALPSVNFELRNISRVHSAVTLKDEEFVLSRTEQELSEGDYSIVHMATHGEFSSDYRDSYLLTYDNKLTMSELEKTIGMRQFTDKPLDLLVLSACQTAVGDERAALGLAGVAIKAGARSAIATLWFINDEATSRLMSDLYKQLVKPGINKAQALQSAQLQLIKSKRRSHPYYWSPFILIGNWM
jgi:CHAT domain-containing protein